jgi:hypothetical protein
MRFRIQDNVLAARLHDQPNTDAPDSAGTVRFSDLLEKISDAAEPGWWKVRVVTPDAPEREGFIQSILLTEVQEAVPSSDRPGRAFDFFVASQWTKAQAAGLIASIEAESSFDPSKPGDGGQAYGLCQWHPDRQENFLNQFGHSIKGSTFDEQLQFVNFELRNGKETSAGALLAGATTARQAGETVCEHYERPNDPEGTEKARRGGQASDWFNRFA